MYFPRTTITKTRATSRAAIGARRPAAARLVSPRNAAASSPNNSQLAQIPSSSVRAPAGSMPGMLPRLRARNTHSCLPRKLPVIWARRELSGQAVSCLGLELQHFRARQAGPPGRLVAPNAAGNLGLVVVVLGLVVVVLGKYIFKKVQPRVSGSQERASGFEISIA